MSICDSIREIEPNYSGYHLRIGIVLSRFNEDVGEGLLSGCCTELDRMGIAAGNVTLATVPGALELPLALMTMAQTEPLRALRMPGRTAEPALQQREPKLFFTFRHG